MLVDPNGDGVFEPGDVVTLGGIVVQNMGGLDTFPITMKSSCTSLLLSS